MEKFKSQYPDLSTDQIQEVIDRQKEIMNMPKSGKEGKFHPLFTPPKVTPQTLEQRVSNALNVDYGSSTTSTSINIGALTQNTSDNKPITIAPSSNNVVVVNPPSPKNNVVVNYNREKENTSSESKAATGNKIPEFDAERFVSSDKIKTLGISI